MSGKWRSFYLSLNVLRQNSTYNPVCTCVGFECGPGMVPFTGDHIVVVWGRKEKTIVDNGLEGNFKKDLLI